VSVLFLGVIVGVPPAFAGHNGDLHSPNIVQLAHVPHSGARGSPISSDLAFWGTLLFAGDYGGFRIFRIADPSNPVLLADVKCNGGQGDVGVWDKLLFVSIDRTQTKATCDSADAMPGDTQPWFEGIRIFDVSDPRHPRFITVVQTNCGSHTHTVVPDLGNDRVLLYVPYSGADSSPTCVGTRTVDIVEVPLGRPENAGVIGRVNVAPADSCHDIGAYLPKRIAAAACLREGQLWDISNPASPVITTRIANPDIYIWHSAAFTWDGAVAIFGDEFYPAGLDGGCVDPHDRHGRVWFYNRAALEGSTLDPVPSVAPFLMGSYKIPRPQAPSEFCTAHNYNVMTIPNRYVLVSGFYEGGATVVDFTIPAYPREIAFYDPLRPLVRGDLRGAWSSYWYNGFIYVSDLDRDSLGGVSVFRLLSLFRFPDPDARNAVVLHHLNPQTQERPIL